MSIFCLEELSLRERSAGVHRMWQNPSEIAFANVLISDNAQTYLHTVFWQCLPFSWATLRGKHCRQSIVVMSVVDTFWQSGPHHT